MMKLRIMVTLVGLSLMASGAMGGVIFQDDFSAGIGNWSPNGPGNVFADGNVRLGITSPSWSVQPVETRAYTSSTYDIATSLGASLDVVTSVDMQAMNIYTYQDAQMWLYCGVNDNFGLRYNPSTGTVAVQGKGGGVNITSPVALSNAAWLNTPMYLEIKLTSTDVIYTAWDLATQTSETGTYTHGMDLGTLPEGRIYLSQFCKVTWQNYHSTYYDNVLIEAVPEPATLSLLGLGGVLALVRRRR